MKTTPWTATPQAPEGLSAAELSIADRLTFQQQGGAPKKLSLLVAVYAAILSFRQNQACELRWEKYPEPLLRFDGKNLHVLEALRLLIADVEAMCQEERTQGVKQGVDWARANPDDPPVAAPAVPGASSTPVPGEPRNSQAPRRNREGSPGPSGAPRPGRPQ